jgi:DNA-binding NtrC family response regulator
VDHFLQRFARQEHKGDLTLDPTVRARLLEHAWEGNVRELENMIYRAVVLAESAHLGLEDFPMLALAAPRHASGPARPSGSDLPGGLQEPGAAAAPARAESTPAPAAVPVVSLDQVEMQAIARALVHTGGNMSRAATQLGIGRATLYRKYKKYGLAPP